MSGTYHDEPIPGRGSGQNGPSSGSQRPGIGPGEERRGGFSGSEHRDRSPGSERPGRAPDEEYRNGFSASDRRSRALGYRPAAPKSSWNFISEDELFGRGRGRTREPVSRDLPEKLRSLLEMTVEYEVDEEKRTEAFLQQAEFMAGYEEDYRMRGIPIRHIFVAYQEMPVDELRGYFSWRSRLRRGEKAIGGRDFVRLYTAELINLAGVSSAQEGFDRLLRLRALAGAGEEALADASMKHVLRDYIIAHGLDRELALAYCIDDPEKEAADLALTFADTADDYSLYAAIRTLAGEQIDGSKFLPQIGEDACHVIARAVRLISAREKTQKGKGIIERLLGVRKKTPHTMFSWLPFRTEQQDGYRYEVDPVRSYEYSGGRWYCDCYSSYRNPDEIRSLAGIIRECERLLRRTFHYKNALPDRRKDPQTAKLISKVIEDWMKEKAERNRPEVKIDLTRLSGIRAAAEITRERLLEGTEDVLEMPAQADLLWDAMAVPDVPEQEPASVSGSVPWPNPDADSGNMPKPASAPGRMPGSASKTGSKPGSGPVAVSAGVLPASGAEEGIFTPQEREFLQLLLDGKSWKEFISEKQLMLSVFTDAINEKVYDELGDTVIEIEDGAPVLIEDYIEDLREMI